MPLKSPWSFSYIHSFSAAKKINYAFSGIDKTGKIWGLRYTDFIPSIIKSLQELNDSLQTVNQKQQNEISDLKSRLEKLEAAVFSGSSTSVLNNEKVLQETSV